MASDVACEADQLEVRARPSRAASAGLLGACVASGGLAYLAVFDARCHGLVWIALVPYACVLRRATPAAAAYGGAFVGAAVFCALGLSFVHDCLDGVAAPAWFFASLAGAFCWVGGVFLGRQMARVAEWPMVAVLPLSWVTFEYLRHQAFAFADGNGMPLLWIGLALTDHERLLQIADLGGVLALTALVALVNGAVFDLLAGLAPRRTARRPRAAARSVLVALGAVAAAWLYGQWRLGQPLGEPGPAIALVPGVLSGDPSVDHLAHLRRCCVTPPPPRGDGGEGTPPPAVDLFVWPEAAFAGPMLRDDRPGPGPSGTPADNGLPLLHAIAKNLGTGIVVGTARVERNPEEGRDEFYNCLAYVSPQGGLAGIYDKRHLTSLLESIPPWLCRLGWPGLEPVGITLKPGDGFRRGRSAPLFLVGPDRTGRSFRVGPLVCYDVCFPDVHRAMMREGGQAGPDLFLCAMKESFDKTGAVSRLTWMHTRLRAVEFRRPHFRACNGGPSGVFDSCGRVLLASDEDDREPAILIGQAAGDSRASIYARYGDWLGAACSAVVLGLAVLGLGRAAWLRLGRRRHGATLTDMTK